MPPKIKLPKEKIEDFCRRWKIRQMSLFGSSLRDDFDSESDIDILVSFFEDARWSLLDWVDMIEELKDIAGRDVDLVEREALRNPFRLRAILNNSEVIYAA